MYHYDHFMFLATLKIGSALDVNENGKRVSLTRFSSLETIPASWKADFVIRTTA